MAEERAAEAASSQALCPWCSAALPSDGLERCPSCGATLIGETEATSLPGVTAIDAEAIVRNARATPSPRRSRLLSWISGEDTGAEEPPAPPGSLAPPAPDVRREMLRLELQAEVANLQAEADSIVADAQVEAVDEGSAATAAPPPENEPPDEGTSASV